MVHFFVLKKKKSALRFLHSKRSLVIRWLNSKLEWLHQGLQEQKLKQSTDLFLDPESERLLGPPVPPWPALVHSTYLGTGEATAGGGGGANERVLLSPVHTRPGPQPRLKGRLSFWASTALRPFREYDKREGFPSSGWMRVTGTPGSNRRAGWSAARLQKEWKGLGRKEEVS